MHAPRPPVINRLTTGPPLKASTGCSWTLTTGFSRLVVGALACGLLAAASLALAPVAPGYDAWSWLIWGRELVSLDLDTVEGPAFKPLPVAVCGAFSLFGDFAPTLWVWFARAGALLGVALAAVLGWQLAGASRLAGVASGAGVAFAGGYLGLAGAGGSEGLLIALVLLAVILARSGSPRAAALCAVGCGLLRVETWPFLIAAGALAWRKCSVDRRLLSFSAALVPVLWFVPEWLASGDPLRSAHRARVPNPGQPALSDIPALASVGEALSLFAFPLLAGVAGLLLASRAQRREACLLAGAGGAWVALVAAMSQAGFSGEPRYSLPGIALVCVAGGVGLSAVARRTGSPRPRGAVAMLLGSAVALFSVPGAAALPGERAGLGYRARLAEDLQSAVQAMGGPRAVLECGRPYVGHLRGPLLAWYLEVHKHQIGFEPRPPGVLFRSRLSSADAFTPAGGPDFAEALVNRTWRVGIACA